MRLGMLLEAWGKFRGDDRPASGTANGLTEVKARYLSAIDVFRDLPASEIQRLAKTTRMFTCLRGRTIYRAGDSSPALFLLKRGRVQIVRETADGRRLVTAILGPETFFGEMALVGQRFPQDSTAEALDDALVCVLSRRDLEQLILKHPRVGLRFLEQLSARLIETEAVVEDFAFRSIPARLAGTLVRLSGSAYDGTVHLSHQELADMVGAYRESVTLALHDLRARGLVDLGRRTVRVVDAKRLQALAED